MAPLTKPFLTCIFFLSVTLATIRIVSSFGKPPVLSTALKIIVSNDVLSISCSWCCSTLITYIQTGMFWIIFQCHIIALLHLFLYCRTNSEDVFKGKFTTGSSLVIRIFPNKIFTCPPFNLPILNAFNVSINVLSPFYVMLSFIQHINARFVIILSWKVSMKVPTRSNCTSLGVIESNR